MTNSKQLDPKLVAKVAAKMVARQGGAISSAAARRMIANDPRWTNETMASYLAR